MTKQAFDHKKAIQEILSPIQGEGRVDVEMTKKFRLLRQVELAREGVETQIDRDTLLNLVRGIKRRGVPEETYLFLVAELKKLRADYARYLQEDQVRLALSQHKQKEYGDLLETLKGIQTFSFCHTEAPSFRASTGLLALALKDLRADFPEDRPYQEEAAVPEGILGRAVRDLQKSFTGGCDGKPERMVALGGALAQVVEEQPGYAHWVIGTLLDKAKEAFVRAGRAATEPEHEKAIKLCLQTLRLTDGCLLTYFKDPILSLDEVYRPLMSEGSPGSQAGLIGDLASALFDKMYKNGIATNQKPLVPSALVWTPKPAPQPHMPQ